MKKSYTPNMTPQQIAEQDRKRGGGYKDSSVGDFSVDDYPKDKKPWLIKTPVNKGPNTMTNLLDLLKASDDEDEDKDKKESHFERKISANMREMKDNPDKYPGGRKQAIAIAANQAGVSKAGPPPVPKSGPPPVPSKLKGTVTSETPGERAKGPLPGMPPAEKSLEDLFDEEGETLKKEWTDKAFESGKGSEIDRARKEPTVPPAQTVRQITNKPEYTSGTKPEAGHTISRQASLHGAGQSLTANQPKGSPEYSLGTKLQGMGKALTTRSMHIPRPQGVYDPFGVYNSAMKTMTRQNSALYSPEGVAPLVGDTLKDVSGKDYNRVADPYNNCPTHGTVYKSSVGCFSCGLYKSTCCSSCNARLTKSAGGNLFCPNCG